MKLSVAVIGLGQQSLNEYIPALLRRNDVRIVGVYDPSAKARADFIQEFPDFAPYVPAYTSISDMLDGVRPRIAVVALPAEDYFPVVKELCHRRIYFLKEKPFARNLHEAKKMLALPGFGQYGFVAVQRRYNALYTKALEILPQLGRPYLFNATCQSNTESAHGAWHVKKEPADGSCLFGVGYHVIDQMLWWFGMPDKLNAQVSFMAAPGGSYDAEDSASISFRYAGSMHGTLLFSHVAGEKAEAYAVYGPKGYIVGNEQSLSVHDRQGRVLNHVTVDNPEAMNQAQLDFFISRVHARQGFDDIRRQHLDTLDFIGRCYEDALDHSGLTLASQT